jgi:hypothetical protein
MLNAKGFILNALNLLDPPPTLLDPVDSIEAIEEYFALSAFAHLKTPSENLHLSFSWFSTHHTHFTSSPRTLLGSMGSA